MLVDVLKFGLAVKKLEVGSYVFVGCIYGNWVANYVVKSGFEGLNCRLV